MAEMLKLSSAPRPSLCFRGFYDVPPGTAVYDPKARIILWLEPELRIVTDPERIKEMEGVIKNPPRHLTIETIPPEISSDLRQLLGAMSQTQKELPERLHPELASQMLEADRRLILLMLLRLPPL